MKKIFSLITILTTLIFTSCIKNDQVIYKGTVAEFDATTWNANAAGVDYPVLAQIPGFGRTLAVENNLCNATLVDTFITRTTGNMTIRVNLVGAPTAEAREVGYKLISISTTVPTVSFRKKTPACGNNTLTLTDAVEGTHFTVPSGKKITIPANSSFGFLTITILNAGATSGSARVVVLELDDSGTIKSSVNYRRIALAVDQR